MSAQGISTIVLVLTLTVLILTFLHAHRPHVGIYGVGTAYEPGAKDLTVVAKIRNTGNVPANKVRTNMKMFIDGEELTNNQGESRFVLFPGQETSGTPTFHNVEDGVLNREGLSIEVEILYEQPINSFIRIIPLAIRKFRTYQKMDYDPKSKLFAIVSGEAS